MQLGMLMIALPLAVMPVLDALVSSASTQALPPYETVPAVATAWMVGAVDMKNELKGKRCCTLNVT
jgi:hypothetical protein